MTNCKTHIPRDEERDGLGLVHMRCRLCGKLIGYRLPTAEEAKKVKVSK